MAKIRVEIPLRNRNSSGGEGDITQVTLAAFQGIKTLYFEAVVSNTSGSIQYLYLKNASETSTYATLSVPNGTTVSQYLSVQGTMFTSNQVDLKITGSVTSLRTARCIIVMDIGSDPLIHYPYFMYMGGYASTTSTSFVITQTPFFFKYSPSNYNNVNKATITFYGYIENLKSYGYAFIYRTPDFINYYSIAGTSVGSESISKSITSFDLSEYPDQYFVLYLGTGNSMYTTILYSAYGYALFSSTAAFTNYVLPHNQSSSGLDIADSGYESVGISFTTAKTASLKTIAVRMRAIGNPTDSVQIKVFLGNSPVTGILIDISQTISGLSIPTTTTYPEYVIFTFSSPIAISGSTSYCVIMERTMYDPAGSVYEWSTTSKVGSEEGKIFNGTTWAATTAIPIIVFAPDGIDKFEGQYFFGNSTERIPVKYDADYWDGITNTYYFSYDDQINPSSAQLLDGSDNVIPNTLLSSTSTTNQNTTTTPFTMVPDDSLIKTDVTSGSMVGSRIIYISEIISGINTSKIITALNSVTSSTRRLIGKKLSGVIDSAGSIIKKTFRNVAGSCGTNSLINKHSQRTLENLTVVLATMNSLKIILRDIVSSVYPVSVLKRASSKTVQSLINSTTSISRWISVKKSAAIETGNNVIKGTSRRMTLISNAITIAMHDTKRSLSSYSRIQSDMTKFSQKNITVITISWAAATREIFRRLTSSVALKGSVLWSIVTEVIPKELIAVMTHTSGFVIRQAFKLSRVASTIAVNTLKSSTVIKSTIITNTGTLLKQTHHFLSTSVHSVTTVVKGIGKSVQAINLVQSGITRMRVALKTLSALIYIYGSANRSTLRSIIGRIHIDMRLNEQTARSLLSSVNAASHSIKQSLKFLLGSKYISAAAGRMRVYLRTIVALLNADSSARKYISKLMSLLINSTCLVFREITKILFESVGILVSISKMAIRELQGDLNTVASTINLTSREVVTSLKAMTTGFSASKLVHTLYLKTLTNISVIRGWTNRSIKRTLSVISDIISVKFGSRSTTAKLERVLLLSIVVRTLNLEIRSQEGIVTTMAYTGDTIRLYGRFYNWSGVLADVTSQVIRIYDGKGSLIITGTPNRESTGVYYFEYLVPSDYSDPLVYEMSGIFEGSTILARSTIERRWV